MITLRVCNASREDMKNNITAHGEAVTAETLAKEGLKYATANNLEKTLGVAGRGDADLCVGKEDYCSDGKYLMGGKDAVFELKLTGSLWDNALATQHIDPKHLYTCDEIELLMNEVKDNSINDKRLADLQPDDINYRFYDAETGLLKCEADLIYFGNTSNGEVTASAMEVQLYKEGARFMVANVDDPVQPYLPELTWGNLAEQYCKDNTIAVEPTTHQSTIAEIQEEMRRDKAVESTLVALR